MDRYDVRVEGGWGGRVGVDIPLAEGRSRGRHRSRVGREWTDYKMDVTSSLERRMTGGVYVYVCLLVYLHEYVHYIVN